MAVATSQWTGVRAIEELVRARPRFHGEGRPYSLGLRREVLELIADVIEPGSRTLETGCGSSTVVFAASGSIHHAISPSAVEHRRIQEYCGELGIALDSVTFTCADSRKVLPGEAADPLDCVLIDGCHAFPSPVIDWFYTAPRVRVGGLMIVDDTHIKSGEVLEEFLDADAPRWRRRERFHRTSVFEKVADVPIEWWAEQPYCGRTRRMRRIYRVVQPWFERVFTRQPRKV